MQIIGDAQRGAPRHDDRRSVITIGAYDGVHLGHRAVIAQVRERALELGCASVVVTFDRHPASVVRPESAPKLLTDLDQKLELLEATGIDAVYIVRFDEDRATESPTAFIERALVGDLRAARTSTSATSGRGTSRCSPKLAKRTTSS
ncbi:MAG: adenylyltransferase/riboflavin kinase [Actinomycetota bacterium]